MDQIIVSENPLDAFFGLKADGSVQESSAGVPTIDSALEEPEKQSMEDQYDELYDITVNIPANAELSDVTKMALDAYKQQIEILKFVEPKFRNRGFEVAQTYLNLARDSIKQDLELKQKSDRLVLDRQKAKLDDGEGSTTTAVTRDNLFEIVKSAKKNVA